MNKAFTLIELLVVVLIIGILSAIALPQYTAAVEKSRATEAITNISTLRNQIDLYILENGLPTSGTVHYKDFASVELSGGHWENWAYVTPHFDYSASVGRFGSTGTGGNVEVQHNSGLYSFTSTTYPIPANDSPTNGWYNSCWTQETDMGRKICKQYEGLGWKYVDTEL